YALGEQALTGGQDRFQVQVFPFRMTAENMALHAGSPWSLFWSNLKEAYDAFERTRMPPKVSICGKRYAIEESTPGLANALPLFADREAAAPACVENMAHPLTTVSAASLSAAPKAARRRKASRRPRSRHIAVHRQRHASAHGLLAHRASTGISR